MVWDGRFSGNLAGAEKDSPLALAYVDRRGLHLLRDGLGIAPLYYGEINGVLVFASEIKALVGLAEKIEEFPPGHWYHPKKGLVKFFDLRPVPPLAIEAEEAAMRLRACLKRVSGNVRKREKSVLCSPEDLIPAPWQRWPGRTLKNCTPLPQA